MSKITISLIKADIGGWPGHSSVHPALMETAESMLAPEKEAGKLIDFKIMAVGDDLQLLMSHTLGADNPEIHGLAWETFLKGTEKAKELKLYGAGQDILSDAFSGNIKGMGPGVAELEFEERGAEPLIAFMMDKTEPGAFNLPIFKMFADPFNTAGLIIDPGLHHGFVFEIWDIMEHKRVFMNSPEEMYDILALVGAKSRYVIKRVFPKPGKLPEDVAVAAISTEKLYQTAGKYVGKDDPVALVRCQSGLPALGEVLEPFALGHLVSGWMRGSHNGPLMPCAFDDAHPTRFDGPPRVIAAGFQIANGTFVGPVDLFDDPAFDDTRRRVGEITDYMRRHGPFEPHRLPLEEMEYTTLPDVLKLLGDRFADVEQ
ncbi:MAG: fructose-1,6-bisphosphate aldolase/phosphatase [Euryarchaeota archaeon]|nr:fructose-1,6-bisphosphate aldolase/phosphatase [Euryarchaeota archaeon]